MKSFAPKGPLLRLTSMAVSRPLTNKRKFLESAVTLNPAASISDVRKTVLTVKDGVVYRPAELYRELGVRP